VTSPAPALVFIGFMGAGKTTAAAAVAKSLGERFVDADEAFADAHGELPAEMIEREGEQAFREAEEKLVLGLLGGDAGVIALGGGAVESSRVRQALTDKVVVWCRVSLAEARRRVEVDPAAWRPLAADKEEFNERFDRRLPVYEALARAILPEGAPELAPDAAQSLAALRELPGIRLAWARSQSGDYPVFVGEGILGAGYWPLEGRRFCITDTSVERLYAKRLEPLAGRIAVEPGEQSKTLATAEGVLRRLADAGMTRADHVVALGGGVVGDLAGFCAATYQRGVPVVQCPTTLVGQVDSAIGGKTGVDLPEAKNYVGAYHQPAGVLSDTSTLATLPPEELAAGWVEVIKTALLAGNRLWEAVSNTEDPLAAELGDIIFRCALFKAEVVAADEQDSGRRQVLNLGHTVGHAIEAATGYARYRHGEAVGLGLLAALRLSDAPDLRQEVRSLLARVDLPTSLDRGVDLDDVIAALERDKKRSDVGVGFVLLSRPGEPHWGESVDPGRVRKAVQELLA
jgi:shikimate kinase/3-dehydroquinate synthase